MGLANVEVGSKGTEGTRGKGSERGEGGGRWTERGEGGEGETEWGEGRKPGTGGEKGGEEQIA